MNTHQTLTQNSARLILKRNPSLRLTLIWVVAVSFTLLLSNARASVPVPPTNSIPNAPWLDSWSFGDTNYWTTDLGYDPISFANISVATNGPGNSLLINSESSSYLDYYVYEANGATNLNIVSEGALMFWFAPVWASANDTNEPGTGPGVPGRFIEVGRYTTNASFGWWSLYLDSEGNNIYFSAQDGLGHSTNYLSAPITFPSNVWHLIALSWSSSNTSLYVDGSCLTNGTGISVLPSLEVISNGFTVGSDAATGLDQMHGALGSLTTYDYPLDSSAVSTAWFLDGIFHFRNPDPLGNFQNPSYSPGPYSVVSGPGYLEVTGTNTTTCFTNTNVWITNVSVMPGTNNSMNLSFMVSGGSTDVPYDVFATTFLTMPLSNGVWSWMGQAYPCETNVINGITNHVVYLVLGTPYSYDGDGLTAAFESLVLHINPRDPDLAGDGIANGFKFLAGMSLTTPVSAPTLSGVNVPTCPVQ